MVQTTMGGLTFLKIYFVISHEDYIPMTFSQIPKVTFLKLNVKNSCLINFEVHNFRKHLYFEHGINYLIVFEKSFFKII